MYYCNSMQCSIIRITLISMHALNFVIYLFIYEKGRMDNHVPSIITHIYTTVVVRRLFK